MRAGVLVAIDYWTTNGQQQWWPFNTNFVVQNNTMIRCGNQVNQAYGSSLTIWGRGDGRPMQGRMEDNIILAPPFHGTILSGYVGDPNTTNVVYYRYNAVEAPTTTGYLRLKTSGLVSGNHNVVISGNVDL